MIMPHEEFRVFSDTSNAVCQLLQAHFMTLQLIMVPITRVEWQGKQSIAAPNAGSRQGRWLSTLHQHIPAHLLEYYEWTLWVENAVSSGDLEEITFDNIISQWTSDRKPSER